MTKQDIIRKLLKDNIILATGCTEPVAVALCVAKAKETLEQMPERVELKLSKNIIKNAMGVGIPGTGMIGLPIAVSLGVVCGDSSKGLEVLNCAKENLQEAKQWMVSHKIETSTAQTQEKLYIEVTLYNEENKAAAIIAQNHTNFVHVQKNDTVLFHKDFETTNANTNDAEGLTAKDIFEYAANAPENEIRWIMDTIEVNAKASLTGIQGNWGLNIGNVLLNDEESSLRKRVIANTCAASDARMSGATTPVYSNSGSGNQGITCTLPIYELGKELGKTELEINRALMLSHLMSIYIKQHIGRLSALCGVVNASIGVGCGFVLLQGGNFDQVCYVIKNMTNTITGMLCDGAKPSCALKISVGLNSAFDSSTLALRNIVVDQTDGISESDIDKTIRNLGQIGRYGMDNTDELILNIMTNKSN